MFSEEEMYEVFAVFHDKGYTIYEPNHCHIEHQVLAPFNMFKILPEYGDLMPTLCDVSKACSWGSAVNVLNKFIYITQPDLNRVVVIEIQDRSNPVEVRICSTQELSAIKGMEHVPNIFMSFDKYLFLEVINILI